jgi:hypothetical protein
MLDHATSRIKYSNVHFSFGSFSSTYFYLNREHNIPACSTSTDQAGYITGDHPARVLPLPLQTCVSHLKSHHRTDKRGDFRWQRRRYALQNISYGLLWTFETAPVNFCCGSHGFPQAMFCYSGYSCPNPGLIITGKQYVESITPVSASLYTESHSVVQKA